MVRYTVSGTGNMSFVSLPDLSEKFPSELKFLKSEDSVKKQVGASSVSGSITFDCTFIPQKRVILKFLRLNLISLIRRKGHGILSLRNLFILKLARGRLRILQMLH